jgi:tripeptide aminopeptidase
MRLGRIDHETTANMGRIEGGVACNIIPRSVRLEGEARSHDPAKLREQTEHMVACFERAADEMTAEIDGELVRPLVDIDIRAASVGHALEVEVGGGGSDANMFNAHGIEMIILGTGMTDVHTIAESVAVADMVHVAELLVAIMRRG